MTKRKKRSPDSDASLRLAAAVREYVGNRRLVSKCHAQGIQCADLEHVGEQLIGKMEQLAVEVVETTTPSLFSGRAGLPD